MVQRLWSIVKQRGDALSSENSNRHDYLVYAFDKYYYRKH